MGYFFKSSPAVRFELRIVGWSARTLPLCYSITQQPSYLVRMDSDHGWLETIPSWNNTIVKIFSCFRTRSNHPEHPVDWNPDEIFWDVTLENVRFASTKKIAPISSSGCFQYWQFTRKRANSKLFFFKLSNCKRFNSSMPRSKNIWSAQTVMRTQLEKVYHLFPNFYLIMQLTDSSRDE